MSSRGQRGSIPLFGARRTIYPLSSLLPLRIPVILFILLVINEKMSSIKGHCLLGPDPEVSDPFKDNFRWEEFKDTQFEKLDQLKTLVNNVWMRVDSSVFIRPNYLIRDELIRNHFKRFLDFFKDPDWRPRDPNPFIFISTAIGIHNMSTLETILQKDPSLNKDPLIALRIKWLKVNSLATIIHNVFNKTTHDILTYSQGIEVRVSELQREVYEIWEVDAGQSSENRTVKSSFRTLNEISSIIDKEMVTGEDEKSHLVRGLVTILANLRQSSVDSSETLNYFCYGNNEFGVLPELTSIVIDAVIYLTTADIKKLMLETYSLTFSLFYDNIERREILKDKEDRIKALWDEMESRIQRKVSFSDLEGRGWLDQPPGPIIFKCDLPPLQVSGLSNQIGQWGHNLTTGISSGASPTFPFDPPAGPIKLDGTVGYIDDRIPGFSYAGFDSTFQGYIESELVLSPETSCKGTCADYKSPTPTCHGKTINCDLLRKSHCDPRDPYNPGCMEFNKCPYMATNCKRASKVVKMCPSGNDTSRRYEWIRFQKFYSSDANDLELDEMNSPKVEECLGGPILSAVERWEMENGIILRNPQYCELCLCTCMTSAMPGDQFYFDIQPIISNSVSGRVVSAVRFAKERNVIRLIVEEGKPIKEGLIEPGSMKWIKSPTPDITDPNKTVPLGLSGFTRFNLDLSYGPPGTILTGVRFQKYENSLGIEVQVTPISWPENDPSKISLKPDEAIWVPPKYKPSVPREPVQFINPGNPVTQRGPSMPSSVLGSYVEITTSSYEKDLAQSVIPFFDTQPVFYYEGRRWLRGVGLMHKGKPESGGFIAPMVVPARPYPETVYSPIPKVDF